MAASVNSTEILIRFPAERMLPVAMKLTPSSDVICWELISFPLKLNAVWREMISIEWIIENSVMMSSTIPSTRYSFSSSLFKFLKGRTNSRGFVFMTSGVGGASFLAATGEAAGGLAVSPSCAGLI